jgi:hypothetical protein
MRALADDRAELIEALVAESDLDGITASLLEKDEHLTDALRAVFALQFECVDLVFCGGNWNSHCVRRRCQSNASRCLHWLIAWLMRRGHPLTC